MRTSDLTGPRGLRIVFEDTLQPFVEISCDAAIGYVLANLASVARMHGDHARARALLDEAAGRFAQMDDTRGSAAVLVRRAYLDLAEGSTQEARACLEHALLLRRQLNDRRGLGLALAGLGLIDTAAGDYDNAERHLAEARADLPARRRPLGAREHAVADGGPRAGARPLRRRRSGAPGGTVGDRRDAPRALVGTHACRACARWRHSRATPTAPRCCSRTRATATPRRDDDLGVASVEERLRSLAKAPLSPGKGAPDKPSRATTTKGTR